ncbi:MAG: YdcF family protein [Alphaproteobacteria bacterium]|nr:YdcF family protein [Alphaproteobacteria bacterium]
MTQRGKIILSAFMLFDAILSIWVIGFILFWFNINEYNMDAQQQKDAIIVLTGGQHRIEQGIKLLEDDKANVLFISGVSEKTSIDDLVSGSEIDTNLKNKIELGYMATTTVENAAEIKNWITEKNIKSAYLVTSNYHIPRSLAELSAVNLNTDITPYPVYSERIAAKWWQSWETFIFLAKEYNKYLCVCLRNSIKF